MMGDRQARDEWENLSWWGNKELALSEVTKCFPDCGLYLGASVQKIPARGHSISTPLRSRWLAFAQGQGFVPQWGC